MQRQENMATCGDYTVVESFTNTRPAAEALYCFFARKARAWSMQER